MSVAGKVLIKNHTNNSTYVCSWLMEGEREEQVSLGFRCVSMAAVADKIQQNSDLSVAGNRGTGRDARVAVCGDSGTWC